MITTLHSLLGFYGEGVYPGLRSGSSSPVIEQLADLPGPKKQANISKRRGEFNG
jgi:hypothetical protein